MKAIILAAGFGTRMLPITKTIPKELLPVGNKPVIQYAVEGLSAAGIKNIVMVTSQGKKSLEDYFDKNYELEDLLKKKGKIDLLDLINKPKNLANYTFVKQEKQLGTGHAVLQTQAWIPDDYFIVVFGDAIYPPDLFIQMMDYFDQHKAPIVVVHEVDKMQTYKYGVVKIEQNKIIDIVEKPKVEDVPSNLISSGVFLLPQKIFSLLKDTPSDFQSGEIYLPNAIKKLMLTTAVLPLKVKPFWDVGTPDALLEANVYFAKKGQLF